MTGEYYLRGVMETASGFKLDPDSTFQFFFSYGALDRYGEGKWTWKDGKIILTSKQRPAPDFSLLKSAVSAENSITIKILETNSIFLSGVQCTVQSGEKSVEAVSDKDGIIRFPKMPVNSLKLVFQFCAEKTSVFNIENPGQNYFEFGFQPWIMEVFFEKFTLTPLDDMMIGKHPLLAGISYDYKKTR